LSSPLFGENSHFDLYFSDGLKPPTREAEQQKMTKVSSDNSRSSIGTLTLHYDTTWLVLPPEPFFPSAKSAPSKCPDGAENAVIPGQTPEVPFSVFGQKQVF